MSGYTVQFSDKDMMLVKNFAARKGESVDEFIRKAVIETIEDELDLEACDRAYAEFLADPKTYTLDEVKRMLDMP